MASVVVRLGRAMLSLSMLIGAGSCPVTCLATCTGCLKSARMTLVFRLRVSWVMSKVTDVLASMLAMMIPPFLRTFMASALRS